MRKKVLILTFVLCSTLAFAQNDTQYFGYEPFLGTDSIESNTDIPAIKDNSKFNVGFSAGSMFTNYYGNNIFTNYAAPEIRYNFTDKFTLSAGTMVTYSSSPSFMDWNSENSTQANRSSMNYYMFMKGSYLISDKLRVYGSAVFDMSPDAFSRNTFNSFGFDYKIGKDTYISAGITIYNVNNPNPLFRPLQPGFDYNPAIRPFGNSMFSEPFPTW